jgi:hypothetical protein
MNRLKWRRSFVLARLVYAFNADEYILLLFGARDFRSKIGKLGELNRVPGFASGTMAPARVIA